jgi:hypothetical protein
MKKTWVKNPEGSIDGNGLGLLKGQKGRGIYFDSVAVV